MFSVLLSRTVSAQMVELQALAALLAIDRAREQALGGARRIESRPIAAAVGGIALGWLVGTVSRRAS